MSFENTVIAPEVCIYKIEGAHDTAYWNNMAINLRGRNT